MQNSGGREATDDLGETRSPFLRQGRLDAALQKIAHPWAAWLAARYSVKGALSMKSQKLRGW